MRRGVKENTILKKSFAFSLDLICYYRSTERGKIPYVILRQLLRSGTSIGANVEEAMSAWTYREFLNRMSVALREARETMYWLRLVHESELDGSSELVELMHQATESNRILSRIVHTGKNRLKTMKTTL